MKKKNNMKETMKAIGIGAVITSIAVLDAMAEDERRKREAAERRKREDEWSDSLFEMAGMFFSYSNEKSHSSSKNPNSDPRTRVNGNSVPFNTKDGTFIPYNVRIAIEKNIVLKELRQLPYGQRMFRREDQLQEEIRTILRDLPSYQIVIYNKALKDYVW